MITDQIGRHEVLLPINHNHRENKCMMYFFKSFQYEILAKWLAKVTNLSILENLQFGRISGCCYGYSDKLCVWWIKMSALKMIGWCNCPISANCPIFTVRFEPYTRISDK